MDNSYADINYYRIEHSGRFKGSDEQLEKLLYMASRKIDGLTFNRIRKSGFANLSYLQRELIQLACCFQADYMDHNGIDNESAGISSYSALDIKVSFDKNTNGNAAKSLNCSEVAYMLLDQTGLMCKVVG